MRSGSRVAGWSLINLAVQTIFNPMQRLEPVYAAALLALNIVDLLEPASPLSS